ncbi:MAG: hypothetical protein LUF81_03955 [Clostridiales bacterium]|nr:hypothetical protein [Clostridiales bacterium]
MRNSNTGACIQKSALLNGQEGKENQSRWTGAAAEENRFRDGKSSKTSLTDLSKEMLLPEQKTKKDDI